MNPLAEMERCLLEIKADVATAQQEYAELQVKYSELREALVDLHKFLPAWVEGYLQNEYHDRDDAERALERLNRSRHLVSLEPVTVDELGLAFDD